MLTDPTKTTAGDICSAALRECGALGLGQTASAEQLNDAQSRLQMMLQQWERKRWLVYHLVTLSKVMTGAVSYTVGPGGDIDTGTPSVRPARIESAFIRQISNLSPPNQPDWVLEELKSREDYNNIGLKQLSSFPSFFWYDAGWPLGSVYPWPVPQSGIYELFCSVMSQLPASFANQAVKISLPYEYYGAMLYNLAIRLAAVNGLAPRPDTMGFAKDGLNVVRGNNYQIARLQAPSSLIRPGIYNIVSDRSY